MKKTLSLWGFAGFAVTSLVGTVLHYLYDWSGQNPIVAVVSGVNESTWEHMKLLFFPMFFFALFQSFIFRDCENFWCVKLTGILAGLLSIPILFYTYNGIVGSSPAFINIAIFYVAAAVCYIIETKLFQKGCSGRGVPRLCLSIICLIAVLFAVFTFFPPQIPLFRDPIDLTYGITKT